MAFIGPIPVTLRDGSTALVRTAAEDDAAALLGLEEHMFDHNPFKVVERGERERSVQEQREYIARHLEHPNQLLLLGVTMDAAEPDAARNDYVLADIAYRSHPLRKMSHHGTFGIAVREGLRSSGLGTVLIRALLDWAAEHPHLDKICLGTLAGNAGARRLYERLGFRAEAVVPKFFKFADGTYSDDVQMAIYVKPGLAPPGFLTWRRGATAGA